jgi:hypothetical protein
VTSRLDAKVAGELLTALEDLELPLLQWGVTSGMLSREEVLEVIEGFVLEHPGDFQGKEADDVVDELLEKALLFQVPAQSPPRYRTRLAETLRLTTRLRQLFGPQDLANPSAHWWETGPTLVTDYRLHVAPRKYPTRDVPAATALGELRDLSGWTQVQGDVAAAQVKGRDLARFQVDAAAEIFQALADNRTRGVIIGAGTGSGKTLAFYLPAFTAIAPSLILGRHQVHTLALYPRNELLRDQLREAVSAALDVADMLKKSGRRRIRVGALYGATPWDGKSWQVNGTGTNGQTWRKRGRDVICPYLPCPACDGDLLWSEADRLANRDKLTCGSCGLPLDGDVALTRTTLQDRPPDVLFTSTEMLNQQASSSLGRLLGWRTGSGPAMTPRLVLLDEVHTYSGVHGAQVALLLRRWRHSVRGPVTFVGLSATLRDAQSFFAQLTGVDQVAVESIEPKPQDITAEGREYALVVRGDPVSGASLLSTSIQAAMLYGRILDPPGQEYVHGSVGFLFTDDLDVTNRFYDDLRDAEGAQGRYKWGGRARRVLAGLRSPDARYESERYRDGQSWNLVQRIGWPLDPAASAGALRVGRTSSQDAGVDRSANLIVATASLEVGFNDPRVGLVLQHKAPRDAASFIQRRGRAGRLRSTRPWTMVALSDYGRDRLAYQAYDTLFSPELSARQLPIGNRSVLKMQGAQALLDWLAVKLGSRDINGDPRQILRAPKAGQEPDAALAGTLTGLLEATLKRQDLQDDLAKHLQRALRIPSDEVQALLWEHPRSLLLSVVPTALRRARSFWHSVREDPGAQPSDLLPEFITRALFDALNVPEVWFDLPFNTDQEESLPVERALREAVPGRVSRRYGYQHQGHRTWLPLPLEEAGGVLNLDTIALRYTREGTWIPAGQDPVQVIRPHVLRLTAPPREVADQSQGFPIWGTQIIEPTAGLTPVDIPDPSAWAGRIISAGYATHAAGNPAEVRRMTTAATCETSYENGKTVRRIARYVFEGSPAALGFRLTVDGARFDLAPLDLTNDAVARHLSSPGWRSLAFATAIREDPRLDGIANTFQRGWLTLVYQIAFALAALDSIRTLDQVQASLARGSWSAQLPEILRVLYRDDDNGAPVSTRREAELTELSKDESVRDCLDEHGRLLWTADTPQLTADLAQRSYRDTVAAAVLAAALRACPDARELDFIVDVIPSSGGGDCAAIWLTETSLGGLGLIEQLASYYAADPRRFWGLVDSALGPNDYEYVDATLTLFLEHMIAEPHGAASQAMSWLRAAKSARETDAALRALRDAWAEVDGYPRQSAVSALSARLLRQGSSRSIDEMTLGVVHAWDQLQDKLGFEVDARVIAFGVGSGQIPVPGGNGVSGDQVFSLLWPRGYQARAQHLGHYQQYASEPLLDRLLVMAAHEEQLAHVDVTKPGWQNEYIDRLAQHGVVVLTAPVGQSAALSQALRAVPALPVDRDVLRVYGEVREVVRLGAELQAVVGVREAVQ